MSHLTADKKIIHRVRRIQGQMNSVHDALIDPEKSCISVLQQVAAIKGAVNGLMRELIEAHLKKHVLGEEFDEQELEAFLKILKQYQS